MTEVIKELLPDSVGMLDAIANSKPWNPVYRRALEDILKSEVVRAALREVLTQSDETLKNIGLADLTNEDSIKKCLRAQGVATGLSQAVECICALAATAENENAPQENDV